MLEVLSANDEKTFAIHIFLLKLPSLFCRVAHLTSDAHADEMKRLTNLIFLLRGKWKILLYYNCLEA